MKVLVINCGSSSLKYQLIDSQTEEVLAKGLCERIGIDGSKLTHKPTGKEDYVVESPMKDHQIAVKLVLDALTDKDHGVITDIKEISAVGHRVLHAGQVYSDSIVYLKIHHQRMQYLHASKLVLSELWVVLSEAFRLWKQSSIYLV